jgi:hypothetical protein
MNNSHEFSLIIFSFLENWAILNNVIQKWRRKTKQMYDKPKHQNLCYNLKCKNYNNYKLLKHFLNCSCKHMQIKDECVTLNFFAKNNNKRSLLILKIKKIKMEKPNN